MVRDLIGGYLETAERLGRRTGEMHVALASDAGNPAFAPEPFTAEDLPGHRRERDRGGATRLRGAEARPQTVRRRSRGCSLGRVARAQQTVLDRLHARSRRSSSAPRRSASTATITSARCCGPRGTSTSSTSKGSRPSRSSLRRDEAVAAQGRRRHDAVVQLRGARRALRLHRRAAGRVRTARRLGRGLGDLGDRRVPARILRRRRGCAVRSRRTTRSATSCCGCSCSKRRCTN